MAYDDTLFQLGMDLTRSSPAQKEDTTSETAPVAHTEEHKHFFTEREGVRFAGTHLIIDLFGAKRLDDLKHIERTLRKCIEAAGASLLHIHLHQFAENDGVSGVALHDKGHLNIQTWPERRFVAIDMLSFERSGDLRESVTRLLEDNFQAREVVTKVSKRATDGSRPAAIQSTPIRRRQDNVVRTKIVRAA